MIKRRHVASSSSSSSTLPTSSSSSSGAGADHDVHAGHPPSSSSHNDHGGGNKDDDGNADGRVVVDDDDGGKKGAFAPRGGTATAAAAIAAVDVARRSSRPIVGMAFLLVVACLVGVMVTGGDDDDGGGGGGGGNFGPASRRGDARRRRRGPPGRVRGGGGSGSSREEAEVLGRISAPEADGPAVLLPRGAAGGGHEQRQHGQRESENLAEADAAPHQPAGDPPSSQQQQQQQQQRQLQFDDLAESIRSIRSQFETRYGGADAAYAMLRRGIRTFDPPPPPLSSDGGGGGSEAANESSESSTSAARARRHTALRILRSASHPDPSKRTFVAAFGGYSVTVGRGNLFSQSFPFVMERILHEPLSKLGVDLIVRNAAIGGIPSFPYGWCLSNFLGNDADLISWDYGMNEGNDAVGLEAYIRHGMNLPKRPMVVVLDTKKSRMDLMRKYVELGALVDPVIVSREDDVVDRALLGRKEEDRPEGLTRWDEWGAPRGSPGQSPWHPKFREHELMGWNLAVHLLEAVEEAGRIMRDEVDWRDKYGGEVGQGGEDGGGEDEGPPPILLPPPQNEVHSSARTILHGTERIEDDDKWYMSPVSCRTTFLPVVSGSMTSIILSGVAELDDEGGEGDAMKSRPDSKYETGWVLDVGKVERDTKRKVERVKGGKGMGYVDMKLALYGIPGSGPVRFWLPYEGRRRRGRGRPEEGSTSDEEREEATAAAAAASSSAASDWFDTVVVCEVNEKRGPGECRMEADVTYTVGGAKSSGVSKLRSVASYLKKEVCVAVPVPPDARITRRKDLASLLDGEESATATTSVLNGGDGDDVGIVLEVQVTGKTVSRKEGACSISHVVWEQH